MTVDLTRCPDCGDLVNARRHACVVLTVPPRFPVRATGDELLANLRSDFGPFGLDEFAAHGWPWDELDQPFAVVVEYSSSGLCSDLFACTDLADAGRLLGRARHVFDLRTGEYQQLGPA